jgi:hypothetical protein
VAENPARTWDGGDSEALLAFLNSSRPTRSPGSGAGERGGEPYLPLFRKKQGKLRLIAFFLGFSAWLPEAVR